jgi:SAM-dependent methyltransferase
VTFATARTIEQREWMDAGDADPAALRHALVFIRRINTLLRYNAATVRALAEVASEDESRSGNESGAVQIRSGTASPVGAVAPGPITVLDIATGSADLPADMLRWSRRRGLALRCVGLDLHPTTLAVAREWVPEVPLVRGDALRLPFADGSFDVATCGMFLHHLDTRQAVQVLREMERITRRGWIVADLLRRRRALAWITLLTLLAGPMVRHDARTSVRQAWSPAEARALARQAGVAAEYREVFGHRFLLMRRKRSGTGRPALPSPSPAGGTRPH